MEDAHKCAGDLPQDGYGPAIDICDESYDDGRLWVGNGEYASQVNFCPYCGFKARIGVKEDEDA